MTFLLTRRVRYKNAIKIHHKNTLKFYTTYAFIKFSLNEKKKKMKNNFSFNSG